MLKTLAVAVAVSALACGMSASAASAKHHAKPAATPQAQTIPGVNPMTNAAPIPAVANPQPYVKVPGVNPM